MFASGEATRAEEAHRQHRCSGAQLPGDEAGEQHGADGSDRRSSRLSQPWPFAAHEAPDDPEQAGAGEPTPGRSRRPSGAVALVEPQQGERQQHQAERDVQPEDPLPGDALDDGAADERAERDRETADRRPRRRGPARAAPAGTAALSRVRVSGITIAPPRPCAARAAISASTDGCERGRRPSRG